MLQLLFGMICLLMFKKVAAFHCLKLNQKHTILIWPLSICLIYALKAVNHPANSGGLQ